MRKKQQKHSRKLENMRIQFSLKLYPVAGGRIALRMHCVMHYAISYILTYLDTVQ